MEIRTINPSISPTLSYQNASAAIGWLVEVLGFRLTALYEEANGNTAYAQLVWRDGSVNVSTREETGRMPPTGPSSTYLTAENREAVDRHFERAVASGANILRPLEDNFTGNHGFTVQDPEGNLWNVGIAWLETDAAKGLPQRRL